MQWTLIFSDNLEVEDDGYLSDCQTWFIQDCRRYARVPNRWVVIEYTFDDNGEIDGMITHKTAQTLRSAKWHAEKLKKDKEEKS